MWGLRIDGEIWKENERDKVALYLLVARVSLV